MGHLPPLVSLILIGVLLFVMGASVGSFITLRYWRNRFIELEMELDGLGRAIMKNHPGAPE
jgi:hypothetical protein